MTLSTQFLTMLTMIGMGAFFGAAFDTYNRFLKRRKRKNWLVFINDVLFWLLQGLLIFYILFQVNQGELRFYIFLALLCGYAGYQSLLKQIYLKWLERLIKFVISVYRTLVRLGNLLIYRPIQALIMFLIAVLISLGNFTIQLCKWVFRIFWLLLKLLFKPIQWILLIFWKLMPKSLKKSVDKLYNGLVGIFKKIKNTLSRWISKISKWKKKD